MKVIQQNKKSITIEINPMELDLLRHAITKESSYRRKTWKNVVPTVPEELMYHLLMNDTAEQLKISVYKLVRKYQDWKILK